MAVPLPEREVYDVRVKYGNHLSVSIINSEFEYVNMTKYHLSKISGVSKEIIVDICAGRVRIEDYSEDIVRQLADALECTVEYLRRSE